MKLNGVSSRGTLTLPVRATITNLVEDVLRYGTGLRRVSTENLKGYGVSGGVKPFSAPVDVAPSFKVHPLWIFAHEKIAFEFRVRCAGAKPLQVSFSAGVKFGFLGCDTAIRACQDQHATFLLKGIENAERPAPR